MRKIRIERSAAATIFMALGFLVLHIIKMQRYTADVDLSLPMPILNVDFISYYAWAVLGGEFLEKSGRIWGYDPYMGAGYVYGPYLGIGTYLFSLFVSLLKDFVAPERIVLSLELLVIYLGPLCVVPALRNFGGSWRNAWLAFGLVTFLYGNFSPKWPLALGVASVPFACSCFLGVLQVSLLYRWITSSKTLFWLLYSFTSVLLFLIHPGVVLVVLVPSLLIFLGRRPKLRIWLLLFSTCVILVCTNWFWLRPFFEFSDWKYSVPYGRHLGWTGVVEYFFRSGLSFRVIFWDFVQVFCLVFFAEALTKLFFKNRFLFFVFSGWLSVLFLAGFFGSYVPFVEPLQARRFVIPFFIVVICCIGWMLPVEIRLRNWRLNSLGVLLIVFLLSPGKEKSWLNLGHFEVLSNRMPAFVSSLVDGIRTLPETGRILLENRDYHFTHYPVYVSLVSQRGIVGEAAPSTHIKTNFSSFSELSVSSLEPKVFGKPLVHITEQEFSDYLNLYNITFVAAKGHRTVEYFAKRFANLLTITDRDMGAHLLFKSNVKPTWFHEGSGDVSFDLDRIDVKNASQGTLILKFHWLKTFKAEPSLPIEPVFLLNDPLPFIKIDNRSGVKEFTIVNGGF